MNVCLLGERSEQLDEGMKNTSVRLREHLADQGASVTLLDLREIGSLDFWTTFASLDPDVIHLIPGPTPHGLVLLHALAAWKGADTVATATQPRFESALLAAGDLLAPDRLFAQSTDVQAQFADAGFDTTFVPSGVDLDTFSPVDDERSRELRRELGLPEDERIFLHVGHFKEGRDVTSLTRLLEFGEVVVVGSPSTGPEKEIVSTLESAGCTVVTEYVEQIEHYYQAADAYVFPTQNAGHSIQVPLSVFEAMGCDLPVVATRFGGLTDCFEEGDGLRFVPRIDAVDESDLTFDAVDTREKVSEYSWGSIAERVGEVYEEL